MYAARGRSPCGTVFGLVYAVALFVGEAYMPPGRGVRRAGFPVRCPFPALCRAGVHARRTNVRRGLHPQARFGLAPQRRFGAQPGRKARLLARRWPTAAQRRPLGRRSRPRPTMQNKHRAAPATSNARGVSAGGMVAAPTHRPNAAATKKRYCEANGHGGAKTPPYNAKQTSCRPGNVQRRGVSAGGIYAAPTHRPNAVITQNGTAGQTATAGPRPRPTM